MEEGHEKGNKVMTGWWKGKGWERGGMVVVGGMLYRGMARWKRVEGG